MKVLSVLWPCILLLICSTAIGQDEAAPIKPALLVIDVQNQYIPMMAAEEQTTALEYINGMIWKFREAGFPIIRVYHTDQTWGPAPDSEEFQFPESIQVEETDPMVVKNHASAFVKTNLDELLKERNVNTVFLCGLSATGCVLATYFGATEREYETFIIEGALLSPDHGDTKCIEKILSSVNWSSLKLILRAVAE